MFEKSHKMFLFAVSPSFLYALPDMFSFRIASFPSVFFYLGLELGLRLRPGLMFYFVSSSSLSYSPCLWSNHPSTVHLQTWYVLSSELIFLAHCVCLHQQIHHMIPSRFVTHLANPGEYTLLHSTYLSTLFCSFNFWYLVVVQIQMFMPSDEVLSKTFWWWP